QPGQRIAGGGAHDAVAVDRGAQVGGREAERAAEGAAEAGLVGELAIEGDVEDAEMAVGGRDELARGAVEAAGADVREEAALGLEESRERCARDTELAGDGGGGERGGCELALYVALDRGQAGQARGVRGRVGGFGREAQAAHEYLQQRIDEGLGFVWCA